MDIQFKTFKTSTLLDINKCKLFLHFVGESFANVLTFVQHYCY